MSASRACATTDGNGRIIMTVETSVSQTAIYSARPTVRIAGQPDERTSALLIAMKMDECEGGQSALELRLTNWAGTQGGGSQLAFDANSALRLGADLAVYAGDESTPRAIFHGVVSALEMVCEYGKPPELVVLAEDALARARRGRRSKVYAAMSPADVVRAVASAAGIDCGVDGLDAPVATWVQLDETDLGFLRRLLARFDADLQVVDTRLQAAPRKDAGRGTLDLVFSGQLARVRVTADLAHQATAVTVAGWNATAGSAIKGQASALANPGPGQGRSGLQWARDVYGERSEHLASPAVMTAEEADAVAQAALDQRARRFLRAEGLTEGNARLRVGTSVNLSGISAQFDNTYYVVRACHLFDMAAGYRTEFTAECPFLAR
jgi:phage protein D